MNGWTDIVLVALILSDLRLLGSSRIPAGVRMAAAQGVGIAALPLLAAGTAAPWHVWVFALVGAAVKGWIIPAWILRAVRDSGARREMEPLVGYAASIVIGLAMLGLCLATGARLPLPSGAAAVAPLAVPAGLFTLCTGFFLIAARRKAVTQVLGYVVLENGVFALGLVLARETPWLVELGMLLDVFVAVFIMGIIVFQISREFDHMDADRLAQLREGPP